MRLGHRYFFELPVYRLSPEEYANEMDLWIKKHMYSGGEEHVKLKLEFYAKYPERKALFESHLQNTFGGFWQYNEIIGYIKLHFLGNQIRGEYYATQSKRIVRTRRKIFEYKSHKLAPEMGISRDASNEEICIRVNEYIDSCRRELKGRFIDISNFNRVSGYINWIGLYRDGLCVLGET